MKVLSCALSRLAFCCATVFLLSTVSSPTLSSTTKTQGITVDVRSGVKTLEDTIKASVLRSHGNIDKQNIHLVIGIFTGAFDTDPQAAIATRELAYQLAYNIIRPGDTLSIIPWEMDVWPESTYSQKSLVFTSNNIKHPIDVYSILPKSQLSGSQGGHDTEKTIAHIVGMVRNESNTVIVLLANNATSMAGNQGQRPIGESSSEYMTVLTGWRRERSISNSNASVQLPYSYNGSPQRTLDAVIIVPTSFNGPILSPERNQQQRTVEVKEHSKWPFVTGVIIAALGFTIICILLAIYIAKNKRAHLPKEPFHIIASIKDTNETTALLPSTKWSEANNNVLMRLYGGVKPPLDTSTSILLVKEPTMPDPSVWIAELVKINKHLVIRPNPAFVNTRLIPGNDAVSQKCLIPYRVSKLQKGLKISIPSLPSVLYITVKINHKFPTVPIKSILSTVICLEAQVYIAPKSGDEDPQKESL